MGNPKTARMIVQVLSTLFALLAIGFTSAAVFSSGWQIMYEPGSQEIHQHGLYFDYIFTPNVHMPGMPGGYSQGGYPNYPGGYGYGGYSGGYGGGYGGYGNGGYGSYYGYPYMPGQWIITYKFGDSVYGNEVHRAQPYQLTAFILLVLTLLCIAVGVGVSFCAATKSAVAISWTLLMFLATVLDAAALIQFYVNAMHPEYRFSYLDRRIEQIIGYSYWYGVGGLAALILAMITSIVCTVLISMANKRTDLEMANRPILAYKREFDYGPYVMPIRESPDHHTVTVASEFDLVKERPKMIDQEERYPNNY